MIKKITLAESELWNQIISTFDEVDIYYTAEHAQLYKIHGDGEPILIYYYDDFIRAINVVMLRDIAHSGLFNGLPENTYFDIATPYGYGGMLIQGTNSEHSMFKLKQEYLEFCRNNSIISEFVRFHPILENYKKSATLYNITEIGPNITIKLESKEAIQVSYENSNRRNINKAKKNKLDVYLSNDPALVDTFMSIYKETMDRDDATEYYYFEKEYYDYLFDALKQNVLFAYVKKDDSIIAMSIFYLYNSKIHYHLSASKTDYTSLYPTNLLIDFMAHWGSEHGFTEMMLGGGLGGREDNLFRFKRKFNKNFDRKFYIGQRIFDKEMYEKLVKLRGEELKDLETNYFPKYRKP